MEKKMTVRLLPLFGFLFLSAYLRSAAVNVVYTDYIRLVNSYLEDVWSIQPYLRPDVLTRIPANYVQRIVNVELFHYSTMFDMMLGAFFLALSTLPLGIYCVKKKAPHLPLRRSDSVFLFPEQVGNADQRLRLGSFHGVCLVLVPLSGV